MRADEYLMQIWRYDSLIKNKQFELDSILAPATCTVSTIIGERVKTSSDPQRAQDTIGGHMDAERRARQQIESWKRERQKIISTMEKLDPPYYRILHDFYVKYKKLGVIALENRKSYSWAKTLKASALESLQDIITERERRENEQRKN